MRRITQPRNERFRRFASLVDVAVLQQVVVAIVGLGTLGAAVAEILCRLGVGAFLLIDGDVVEQRNLHTVYRNGDVGRLKADALREILHGIHPEVSVRRIRRMLTPGDADFFRTLSRVLDLVIFAADDFRTVFALADAVADIVPSVMGVFGARASVAEVAFSLPGVSRPLRKTMGARRRMRIDQPAALPSDCGWVAHFTASVCLSVLLRQRQRRHRVLLPLDPRSPLFVLGTRKEWIFSHVPDDQPWAVFNVRMEDLR